MNRWHEGLVGILLLTTLLPALPGMAGAGETVAAPSCFDVILNGDFEGTGGWTINISPATPAYAPAPNRSGTAMRLGITEVPNRNAYSSIEQTIAIPADAVSAQLRWDFFAIAEGPIDADKQQVTILDPLTRGTIEILWDERQNAQTWLTAMVDMMIYKGQTLVLYFNVFNDGVGAVNEGTAMYLDNVSLEVCVGVTTTPTITITTTPTAVTATLTPTPTVTPNVQITFIEYDPPGPEVEGEYVLIQNPMGTAVNMTDWILQDANGHTFKFPPFTLNPGASVRVWTKSGINTAADLYWGRGSAVWNNDGDIAYLRDSVGTLIDEYSYLITPTPTHTVIATPTPTPTATATPFTVTPAVTPTPTVIPTVNCVNLLLNSGFEEDAYWQLHRTPLWPTYAGPPNPVHSGARSVMLGNQPLPEAISYSSVRQAVSIPADAQTARIEFWYWAQTDDTDGGDRQQLLLLDPISYARVADLWRPSPLHNERNWQYMPIDLTPYRGQWVLIYFNVFNDGDSRRTLLFLDDVFLFACYPFMTATPTVMAMGGAIAGIVATPTPAFIPPMTAFAEATMPKPSPVPTLRPTVTAMPKASPVPTLGPAVTTIAVEEEAAEALFTVPGAAAARANETLFQRWPIASVTLGALAGAVLVAFITWWIRSAPG